MAAITRQKLKSILEIESVRATVEKFFSLVFKLGTLELTQYLSK